MTRRRRSWWGLVWALLLGCRSQPNELAPYGEVLVEIDTNLAAVRSVSRVRIDVFSSDGRWLSWGDFATPNATDFPLSFSVYSESPSASRSALLRVRGYPDGRKRDYLGERFEPRPSFVEPRTSASLAEACRAAATLEPGDTQVARLRGEPFSAGGFSCGAARTKSGLAVFRVRVGAAGDFRVAVSAAQPVPGSGWDFVANTVLTVRRDCEDAESELACNDDRSEYSSLSALTAQLESGDYFALVGNVARGPMDVTLHVASVPEAEPTESGLEPQSAEPHEPRLLIDGVDATPDTEPQPNLTLDRLAQVVIEPGRQATAHVLLHGDCLGTMADLRGERTCIDQAEQRAKVTPEPLVAGRTHAITSAVGSWSGYRSAPCRADAPAGNAALLDERVCLQAGAFVLGDGSIDGAAAASVPERVAVLPAFFLDRYEYSVARYREAKRRGFEPPDNGPVNNFEPVTLDAQDPNRACTWNESLAGDSLFAEQELLPLNCVSWFTARALCSFDAGDLPTVAEREYAASAEQREQESLYPWGDEPVACDGASFGRWPDTLHGNVDCRDFGLGVGPVAVNAEPWASSDVTAAGVVALGGGVAEWTRDSHRAYSDACWQSQTLAAPSCWEQEAPLRTIMGGSWRDGLDRARASVRVGGAPAGTDASVGFRCSYPDAGEP